MPSPNPLFCAGLDDAQSALTDRVVDLAPALDGFDVAVHRGEVRAYRHDGYAAPPSIAQRSAEPVSRDDPGLHLVLDPLHVAPGDPVERLGTSRTFALVPRRDRRPQR